MAIGNFTVYSEFAYRAWRGDLNWINDAFKAMLLDNTYAADRDAQKVLGDISAHEIADAGYARVALAGKAIAQDANAPKRPVLSCNLIDFAAAGGGAVTLVSPRYLAIFRDSGVAGTSYLCGYCDLNSGGAVPVQSSNSAFNIAFNAPGLYRVTP